MSPIQYAPNWRENISLVTAAWKVRQSFNMIVKHVKQHSKVVEDGESIVLSVPDPSEIYLLWDLRKSEYFFLDFQQCNSGSSECTCRKNICLNETPTCALLAFTEETDGNRFVNLGSDRLELHKLERSEAVRHAIWQSVDCIAVLLVRDDWLMIPVLYGSEEMKAENINSADR